MTDIEKAIAFLVETKLGCKKLRDKELSNVCDISIKAIEKQIPKKLSYKGIGSEKRCQGCGEVISEYDDENYYRYDYCPNCGQALDWSVEE